MSSRNTLAKLEDIRAQTDAWSEWLESVPDEEREEVAGLLINLDVTTDEGMLGLHLGLLGGFLQARLSPVVIQVALPLLDRMIAILWRMKETHGPDVVTTVMQQSVTRVLQEQRVAEPRFIGANDIRPAVEDGQSPNDIFEADDG